MRDAAEREEQFRKRIQPNDSDTTPSEVQSISSSTPSFHTPVIDESPSVVSMTENNSVVASSPLENIEIQSGTKPIEKAKNSDKFDLVPSNQEVSKPIEKTIIRHTATEETTEPEYRRTVKYVPSNVLKSTIQNYLVDHDPLNESEGKYSLTDSMYQ